MNTLQVNIFTDATAEFNNIQSSTPSIDLTDSPLPDSLLNTFTSNTNFLITAAQGSVGYYEVEFNLANSFWGCNFSFGNSACGIQVRQGISHMIDKNSFVSNEAVIAGHSAAIDNPVPTTSGGGLLSPNPCGYDASFPQTGPNCSVELFLEEHHITLEQQQVLTVFPGFLLQAVPTSTLLRNTSSTLVSRPASTLPLPF